jgi:hypothetical protein
MGGNCNGMPAGYLWRIRHPGFHFQLCPCMLHQYQKIALALSLTGLVSCDSLMGKEVGRNTFVTVSAPEKLNYQRLKLKLAKGEKIQFWADMDIAYDGPLELEFFVQLPKALGIPSQRLDPLHTSLTVGEVKTVVGEHTTRSFSGRMGSFEAPAAGEYDFGTLLLSSDNPTLQIKKADLVFKK